MTPMMTGVYLTTDTELSSAHFARHGPAGLEENFARAVLGRGADGDVGIVYQMARLDAHRLKGVFFVDPMVALVAGVDMVRRIVDPILGAGHDVQLHAHSEWLAFATRGPTDGRTGRNMADFPMADQARILDYALGVLIEAGVPMPVAFRAGNYGANDDTLRALASMGLRYDSSFSPGIANGACRIGLDRRYSLPVPLYGVIEVPIGAIEGGEGPRHMQITALSSHELAAALRFAAAQREPGVTIVSHSFELMCRERLRANRILLRRFDRLCALLSSHPGLRSATYAADPPQPAVNPIGRRLPHQPGRTLVRTGEQLISNGLYGAQGDLVPSGISRHAQSLRDRLVLPLQDMMPLQNVALDILLAV